ncbi:DUF3099 domain-containing protein [Actinophytocola sp. NPDC049390]|uniref:DUF3099 domain-containing protein n=1 Tax=Actinophytocola sp. NPDC049390 TaxID=3363894 RepID=UPI00379571BB
MKSERDDTPVLITEAAPSYEDEYAARKRKYLTMMLLRLPCLILAGVFYQTWWLALGFVVLSIPLPWIAVLIANDRPPRKAEQVNRYEQTPRTLENRDHPVIDG